MKIFNKYFLLVVVSCCMFTACSEDDYTPGAPAEGQGFFFPNTISTTVALDSKATSFQVNVYRSVTGDAATANIVTNDPSGKLTVPASVSFAADAATTTLTIGYDPADFEYDKYENVTLSFESTADYTPYGITSYTFKVGVPAPWKSLGKAAFSDAYTFEKTYQVELQQNEDNPALYRLVDPYSAALKAEEIPTKDAPSEYLTFKLLAPGDKLGGVTVTGKGLVFFDACSTGYYHPDYSKNIELNHPALFTSMGTEASWQYNRVTHFKEDGTPGAVQLAPMYYMDGLGGFNYTQKDGMVTIVFPGYVIADYSVGVTYTGRYTSLDGVSHALANVTLGEDVESAKVAFIKGDDVATAVDQIKDGSLETTEIMESGAVSLPCMEDGLHTFVVVSYAKDKAQESAYVRCQISANISQWTSLGKATYTDAFVGAAYDGDNKTYEVEIQENDNNPGIYRLVNPYGKAFPYNEEGDWDDSRNYYLEINASDPDGVYITVQNTGLNWGDGNFYVHSLAAYYMDEGMTLAEVKAEGYCGKLENGVITFPTRSLLFAYFESSSDLYTVNVDGAFKVVLPGAIAPTTYRSMVMKKAINKNAPAPFIQKFRKSLPLTKVIPLK